MNSKTLVSNLKGLFYIALVVQVAFFVSFAFKWIDISPTPPLVSVVLERYALLITLLGIPGSLKLFSMIMNKNNHPEDDDITTDVYKKAFVTRFGILFLVATMNIVLYAISFNQNYMLLTLITFTAYIFSYPSNGYLYANEESIQQDEEEKKKLTSNKK